MADDVTLGELGRRLDDGFEKIDLRFERVEQKVDDLTAVNATLAQHGTEIQTLKTDVRDLKDARVEDQRQAIAKESASANWYSGRNGTLLGLLSLVSGIAIAVAPHLH